MREDQSGLPPRSSRVIQRKKQKVSLKRIIQGGMILFGTLFFGLIGVELYQAQKVNQAQPVVSGNPAAPVVETFPAGQGKTSPVSSEPSGQPSGETTMPATVETTEPKPKTDATEAVTTPAPQPATPAPATPVDTAPAAPTVQPVNSKPAELAAPATPTPSEQPKTVKHVVEKGDTLFKLSRKYYGNNSGVSRIARYNGLASDARLTAGQVVIIPLAK